MIDQRQWNAGDKNLVENTEVIRTKGQFTVFLKMVMQKKKKERKILNARNNPK